VFGDIYQIAIIDNLLFVVHYYLAGTANLDVYNLDNLDQDDDPITILNFPPPYPICIGKTHLICSEHQYIRILPIAFFKNYEYKTVNFDRVPWKEVAYAPRFIRPKDDHFIAVHTGKDKAYTILKINITSEGLIQTSLLKKGIPKLKGRSADICLYNDRVFFAFEDGNATQILSYDILSDNTSDPIDIPQAGSNCPFQPRFLNAASNIHYLIMGMRADGRASITGNLITLTFGKI